MGIEHQHRLSREVVETPSLQILKTQQDTALSNLQQLALLEGGDILWSTEIPSHLNQSVILWLLSWVAGKCCEKQFIRGKKKRFYTIESTRYGLTEKLVFEGSICLKQYLFVLNHIFSTCCRIFCHISKAEPTILPQISSADGCMNLVARRCIKFSREVCCVSWHLLKALGCWVFLLLFLLFGWFLL